MRKRILSFMLIFSILTTLITALPITVSAATSGTCGENGGNDLTWTLDDDGTLTISGIGDMQDSTAPWYSLKTNIKSVNISARVTSIGSYAFQDCCNLTSVTIPDSVTRIGSGAFWNCSSLTSVTIPDIVTRIWDATFMDCTGLTSVTIGNGVTNIGRDAFCGCSSLTSVTIPDSVTHIEDNAFQDCCNLTSVTIPDSVLRIGYGAFGWCSDLTDIIVAENNTAYCSIDGNLFNKKKTELVQYAVGKKSSNYMIPDGITSIRIQAFCGCSNLTSVTIPDSVTSIGDYAFYECGGLTSVTIPDSVTSIGSGAFGWCSGLTSVTISDGVTSIGAGAFYGCSNITDVYYTGSAEDWKNISISSYNTCLTNAERHYVPAISIPDISADSVTVRTKNCDDLTSGNVILAIYDENGRMRQKQIKDLADEVTFGGLDLGNGTVKAMLWESTDSIKPLLKAAEKSFEF